MCAYSKLMRKLPSFPGASLPNTPTNLQTAATDFTSVRISWDVSDIPYTPETYTILYGTDSSSLSQSSSPVHSDLPLSPGTQQFSVSVSGLQENIVYYFQVEAVNSVGSAQSQLGTFMIEDVRKCQKSHPSPSLCFHSYISFSLLSSLSPSLLASWHF